MTGAEYYVVSNERKFPCPITHGRDVDEERKREREREREGVEVTRKPHANRDSNY